MLYVCRQFACAAGLVMWLVALAAAADPPPFEIVGGNKDARLPDDRVTVTLEKDAVRFDFRVQPISHCTVKRHAGAWPKRVVVRMYLGGLEHFEVAHDKATLKASVLSHSGHKQLLSAAEMGRDVKVEERGRYWTEIRRLNAAGRELSGLPNPAKGEYFEITLPAAVLEANPESLRFSWIDFYRG